MATLSSNALTLVDWAKRQDPNNKTARIIEMLSKTNEILTDMPFIEGNLPTGHQSTMRTGLPTVAWRLINQGTQPSKSKTAQSTESCGILEAWSEVDEELVILNGDAGAFRLSEAAAFIEAMNEEMSKTLFYGNSGATPSEFTGIAVRYSSLSATNAQNIIDAGGTGSVNCSIFLVYWGEQTAHGIYPKGSTAGLRHEDLGLQTIQTSTDVAGTRLRAYQDKFQWKCGFVLKDWRYVVRICNIDATNLSTKTGAADLSELMIKATHRIPHQGMGTPVFYVNRTVFEFLDIQRRDDVQAGGQLKYEQVDGVRIAMFRGIPVKICDALLQTESHVV